MGLPLHVAYSIPRAVEHGWKAVMAAPILLVGTLFIQLSESGGSFTNAMNPTSNLGTTTDEEGVSGPAEWLEQLDSESAFLIIALALGFLACSLVFVLGLFLLGCWLRPGYYRMQAQVLEKGSTDLRVLFGAGEHFWRMVRWRLLKSFILGGNFMVASLPALLFVALGAHSSNTVMLVSAGLLFALFVPPVLFYVSLGLFFGEYHVALDGMNAGPALQRSWDQARGNRLHILLYTLVLSFFSLSGVLLCCVGVLLTGCISETGATEAFLLYTRPEGVTRDYWSMREQVPQGA